MQPNDPVDFFSKFLLNHIQIREQAKSVSFWFFFITVIQFQDVEMQAKVQECQDSYEQECRQEEQLEKERLEAEAKDIAAKKKFFDTLEQSHDLNDNL